MRQIVSILSEIRGLQLKKIGAPESKLRESNEMFAFMDRALTGYRPNTPESALGEVMTSGDFTYAILEFVQREMLGPYSQKIFGFEPFMKMDQVSNFQLHTRYQNRAGVDDLEVLGNKAPPRPGSVDDAVKRQWRVYPWAKQFDFAMQTLVDDDLGYFQDHAANMGRAARRTLEKFISNFLWNATIIARLTALGALYMTTGRLTTARISTARMAFNQRVDARTEPINAALKYIVIHPGLVDTAAQIQASLLVPELATNAANVVRGTFTVIEDPYCAGTAPNLPWFAMSDFRINGISPFVLARRTGVPGPMLLRKKSDIEAVASLMGGGTDVAPIWGDFATHNVVIQIYDEWGTYIDGTDANMVDHRGCYYSSGTAP